MGTVFKLALNGTLTTLYSFCSEPVCADGAGPDAPPIEGRDGNFYGTAAGGGAGNSGTVFKITPRGELTTLHSFSHTDGALPYAPLVQGTDGNFYGTTYEGGANNLGTVFRVTPQGSFTLLHSFAGSDGELPIGPLIQATNGYFFGTTAYGGAYGNGTVFEITHGGLLTLHSFNGSDGATSQAGLVQGVDGNFYGTTEGGGPNDAGTAYEMLPNGTLMTIHSFCDQTGCLDGSVPFGGLVEATNGNFYGTTYNGGQNADGTVYSLSTGLGPFVTFVQAAGKVGETGGILGQGFAGTTSVSLNGTPATFTVKSDTFIEATVPTGATTGYVTVTTPRGTLTSNVPFYVIP